MFFKVDSMPARLVLLNPSLLVGGVITLGEEELIEEALDPKLEPSLLELSLIDDLGLAGVGRDTVGLNDEPIAPLPTLVSPLNIDELQGSELTDADLLAADVTFDVLLGAPHNPSDPMEEVEGENSGPQELNSGEEADSRVFKGCDGHIALLLSAVILVEIEDGRVVEGVGGCGGGVACFQFG